MLSLLIELTIQSLRNSTNQFLIHHSFLELLSIVDSLSSNQNLNLNNESFTEMNWNNFKTLIS